MARHRLKEDGIFDWSPQDSIPIETKDIPHRPNQLMKTHENTKPKVNDTKYLEQGTAIYQKFNATVFINLAAIYITTFLYKFSEANI